MYKVTKVEHVKLNSWGNTTDGKVLFERDYPEGVTFYYVGIGSFWNWHRFTDESLAIANCQSLNSRQERILELSDGKVLV